VQGLYDFVIDCIDSLQPKLHLIHVSTARLCDDSSRVCVNNRNADADARGGVRPH
jgi:hypothetical protein